MLKRFVEDWRFRLFIICLGWGLWWALASIQSYLQTIGQGKSVLVHSLIDYAYVGMLWAAATPFIIFFASKLNYNKNLWLVLCYHLLANLFVLVFRTVPYAFLTKSHRSEDLSFVDNWITIIGIQLLGNVIIYGLIVTSYYAIVWYLGYKNSELKALQLNLKSVQLERQLAEAKLTALRMQLNPHFLFNALHSVASLIRTKQNEHAIETLSILSELLRTTVYEGKANEVTVREEVNFVKKYLSIEFLRFSHRLEIIWDIDDKVLDYKIPNLLLQPLVENALKHGLKETRHGTLSISIKKTSDFIAFTIVDNGAGLPKEFNLTGEASVGLKNTLERLHSTYDSLYEFNIANNPGNSGVMVEMKVPLELAV